MSETNIILIEDDKDNIEGNLKVPKLNLKALNETTTNNTNNSNNNNSNNNNNKNVPLVKTNGIYLLESTLINSKKRESPKETMNPTFKKFRDNNPDLMNSPTTPDATYKMNMLLKSVSESPSTSPNISPGRDLTVESKSNINNILLNNDNCQNSESFNLPVNFVTKLNSNSSPLPSPSQSNSNTQPQPQQTQPTTPIQQPNTLVVNEQKWNELLEEFSSIKNEKNQMEKEYRNQIDQLKQQLKTQQQQAQQAQQAPPIPAPTPKRIGSITSRGGPSIHDPIIIQDYLINEVKVLKSKLQESQNQYQETNTFIKSISSKLDDLRCNLLDYRLQTDSHFNSIEERLHNYALKFGEIDKFIYPSYYYPNTPKTPVSPHINNGQLTPKDPNSPVYYNDHRVQMLSPKLNNNSNNNNLNNSSNTSPIISSNTNNSVSNNNNNNNNPSILISAAESIDKKNIQQKLHQRIQLQEQQKQQQQQQLNLIQQQQQSSSSSSSLSSSTSNQSTVLQQSKSQPNSPKGMLIDKYSQQPIQPNSPHSLSSQVPHYSEQYPPDSRFFYHHQYHPSQYYQ